MHAPARPGPAPALRIVAAAPGYRATAGVGGYPRSADAPVTATLAPAPRAVEGRLCVTPSGGRVELVGTNEPRSQTLMQVAVDGDKVAGIDVALTLTRGQTATFTGHLGTIADRTSALTGGLVPAWLAWILLVLAAVATPVLALAAFGLSLRDRPVLHRL